MEETQATPPAVNEAVEQKKRTAAAYAAVLGDPKGLLSSDQAIVWADMRRQGFMDATTVRADPQGRLDPDRMLLGEGARGLVLHFLSMVAFHSLPEVEKGSERPPVLR